MSEAEARLAALCAAAGYPARLREQIAGALLPRHRRGEPLGEPELRQLAEAVKVLAEARLDADGVRSLIGECRRRHGDEWREELWELALRRAARNAGARAGAGPAAAPAPDGRRS